jgi:radical SAM protein with 4Fe4S-binding SPASM domain
VSFPLVLSPYLRAIKAPTGFFVDDALRGRRDLDLPMQAVVRALWNPKVAPREMARAEGAHGRGAILGAVERLRRLHLVFADQSACDLFVDGLLESQLASVPFLDQIELTNICPFRCPFCPRGVPGKLVRPTGKMDLALFERLLDQAHPNQAAWRPLELHHLGESLVHEQVDRFIAAASERGLPTEMSCNAAMLTPDRGRRMLDAGLHRLIISLDGMDSETALAIRGPAARYDLAERNLDALFSYASTLARPPSIVVQMLDLHRSRHQREAFLERWDRSGYPFVHAYIKDLVGPDPDTGEQSKTPPSYLCSYPWRSVVVLWDGRVVPCCMDADASYVIGDLNTMTLAEIWDGAKARSLREQLRNNSIPCGHLCDGCAWRREKYVEAMPKRSPELAKEEPLYW